MQTSVTPLYYLRLNRCLARQQQRLGAGRGGRGGEKFPFTPMRVRGAAGLSGRRGLAPAAGQIEPGTPGQGERLLFGKGDFLLDQFLLFPLPHAPTHATPPHPTPLLFVI